jgi:hypothetical protein
VTPISHMLGFHTVWFFIHWPIPHWKERESLFQDQLPRKHAWADPMWASNSRTRRTRKRGS